MKIIDSIAKNKHIQRFIKKTNDGKFYQGLNHKLPLVESGYTTFCYVMATQLDRKIPEKRKKPLIYQSLIGGAVGILISKKIDDFAKKHNNKICEELEKLNIPKAKNTVRGMRILLPILITTIILRYLVSVASVPLSTLLSRINKNENRNL